MYKNIYKEYANISNETYKHTLSRVKTINVNGELFNYNQELSNIRAAVYENKRKVILSAHGVDGLKLTITAVKNYIYEQTNDLHENNIYNIYKKIILKNKKIILVGHSLGAFMLGKFMHQDNKVYESYFFGGYIPSTRSVVAKLISSSPKITKILYDTDIFANTLLQFENKPNTIILQNNNKMFLIRTFAGHSITNFINDLNKDVIN